MYAEKFQTIGINRQYDASSAEDATKAFKRSCECCCNRGVQLDCDHCSIAFVHSLVMANFDDINKSKGVAV